MNRVLIGALTLTLCGLAISRPALAQEGDAAPAPADDAAAAEKPAEATTETAKPVAPPPVEEHKRAPNSIYVEGLGAGILYSINYERLVAEDLGVRLGFSYTSVSASSGTSSASASFITIPVTVSYLGVGSKHNMLELGGGLSFLHTSGSASGVGVSSSGSGTTVLPDLLIGYRLHPIDGAGFHFRVGAMAFVGKGLGFSDADPEAVGVLPWLYVSLGASF
jgi:hypothetical protein